MCNDEDANKFYCKCCAQAFCQKHFLEHREILTQQFNEIIIEHNTLKENIREQRTKLTQDFTIFKEIDKWENDSILKIQQIANDTRQQVKRNNFQTEIKELRSLGEQLQMARTNNDYVETTLHKWKIILQKLKDDINTYSSSISLQEDSSEILVTKIHVPRITKQSEQNERFGESNGRICIEDDRRLAMHIGPKNGDAYVRGIGEYSTGKHNIRFIFTKRSAEFVTWFEVISKSMEIYEMFDSSYGKYGWSSDDDISRFGVGMRMQEKFLDMKNKTKFKIILTLDCDNRKISYFNEETKNRKELDVDLFKCPFPWNVGFYLFEVGDCVQLIS